MNSWQQSCVTFARGRVTPWKNWAWRRQRTRYGTGGRISQVQERRTKRGREVTKRTVEVARDIHGMILFGVAGVRSRPGKPRPCSAHHSTSPTPPGTTQLTCSSVPPPRRAPGPVDPDQSRSRLVRLLPHLRPRASSLRQDLETRRLRTPGLAASDPWMAR